VSSLVFAGAAGDAFAAATTTASGCTFIVWANVISGSVVFGLRCNTSIARSLPTWRTHSAAPPASRLSRLTRIVIG
jgi:hypothetical protein